MPWFLFLSAGGVAVSTNCCGRILLCLPASTFFSHSFIDLFSIKNNKGQYLLEEGFLIVLLSSWFVCSCEVVSDLFLNNLIRKSNLFMGIFVVYYLCTVQSIHLNLVARTMCQINVCIIIRQSPRMYEAQIHKCCITDLVYCLFHDFFYLKYWIVIPKVFVNA